MSKKQNLEVVFRHYLTNKNKIHYRLAHILSYNLPIMAVLSGRGRGKTFACVEYLIKDYLRNNHKFMLLRDTDDAMKTELENNGDKLFKKIFETSFKGHTYYVDGFNLYIDDKHCGYAVSISTYYKYKSNNFDDIINLLYDEFIPEKLVPRKIGIKPLINMLETVIRNRSNARIFLMANALDRGNEILEFLGFSYIDKFGIYTNVTRGAVLHYCDVSPAYLHQRSTSIMGRLLTGTSLDENITQGIFNDVNFIYESRPKRAILDIIIHTEEGNYRIYYDSEHNVYVAQDKNNCRNDQRYSFLNELCNSIVKPIRNPIDRKKHYKTLFTMGRIKFENKYVFNLFINSIK